jgi:MFS family permease
MLTGLYKQYMLCLLTLILAFNYVDRVALGVVLQSIKIDLHVSDTALGLLTGLAFALFYSVLGIPIARWADRGNRSLIIALSTAVWSVMVVLCGGAKSFIQLLLVRTGVGVGEAGCVPPALSLISDYFSRAQRPRAMAIYSAGYPLSLIAGFFFAGWLNELYGWRTMFVLLGLPGFLLALLAWLTLREPRLTSTSLAVVKTPPFSEVVRTLWYLGTFRNLLLCIAINFFFGNGIAQWQPTFFIRSFGMSTGEIGNWFALTWGVGGLLGNYLGGELATRFAGNNERLQLRAISIATASFALLSVSIYLTSNRYIALSLMTLSALGLNTINGPMLATIQTLAPERMRAVAMALVYLFANLIGMGLGPLAAGALSDVLHSATGSESLRYALLLLSPGYFWSAWHAWRASGLVAQDLEANKSNDSSRNSGDAAQIVIGLT